MKKILLIGSSFPPVNHISVRRIAAFAKNLNRMGWDVSILTTLEPGGRYANMSEADMAVAVGTDDLSIKRIEKIPLSFGGGKYASVYNTMLGLLILPGSRPVRWKNRVLRQIKKEDYKVDIIWATYPGAGPILTAYELSRMYNIPWVVDFRDSPSWIIAKAPLWFKKIAMKRVRHICATANAWVTITDKLTRDLRGNYKGTIETIPNGYDPDFFNIEVKPTYTKVFNIVYTGIITGTRDPNPLISVVQSLISEGMVDKRDIRLTFFGSGTKWLNKQNKALLDQVVFVYPTITYSEIIRVQKEATILLILASPGIKGKDTGKLFEYIAAARPVLAYPRDEHGIDNILNKTGTGKSCNTEEELKICILRWYRQWKDDGDIKVERNEDLIMDYSRVNQTKKLSILLDKVISAKSIEKKCI